MDGSTTVSDLGIVVIGRNEGERLVRCLRSIGGDARIVYVDSGSTDDSVEAATAMGAHVIPLDLSAPFTAARARNAGRAALADDVAFIQFVDGDCAVQPGWLAAARSALDADPALAAVFGRRREVAPQASVYNWMCDVEWAVAPGEARFFGGDVMVRATALDAAGGYPGEMIAGEEPDLAIRMRAKGWRIACLPIEMTAHDAAISRFGQWWRRAERSGHAFAQLADRHRGSPLQDYPRRLRGVLFWGGVIPLVALVLGLALGALVAGVVLTLPLLQFARLLLRERRRRPIREALALSGFLMLAKPAQTIGAMRYWTARARGRTPRIIEYKGSSMSQGLIAQILDDWRAHGRDWTKPGFRAVAVHRLGVWRMAVHPKLLRAPISLLYRALFRHCRNHYGIELPYTVKLGRGVVIEHQGAIVVHGACQIGDRCIIRQGCTLGLRHLADLTAAPVLEDDVELGAGAVLLGRIRLGRGARVGANAVVLDDVAAGTTVWGIPAATSQSRRPPPLQAIEIAGGLACSDGAR